MSRVFRAERWVESAGEGTIAKMDKWAREGTCALAHGTVKTPARRATIMVTSYGGNGYFCAFGRREYSASIAAVIDTVAGPRRRNGIERQLSQAGTRHLSIHFRALGYGGMMMFLMAAFDIYAVFAETAPHIASAGIAFAS